MTWGSVGWSEPKSSDDGQSSGFPENLNYPRSVWIKPQTTRRFLCLDDAPFRFREHSLYEYTRNSRDRCVCLSKNDLPESELGCPVCVRGTYSYLIGYFSMIDMGEVSYGSGGGAKLSGWVSKKGVLYQFERKAYGAKFGSEEKPGMYQKILRKMKRVGGKLSGCVFDMSRSGRKVEIVGDEIEFVERVEKPQWMGYLNSLGAGNPDRGSRPLELESFDWMKAIVPHTRQQLAAVCGGSAPAPARTASAGAVVSGASYEGGNYFGKDDDDIPF